MSHTNQNTLDHTTDFLTKRHVFKKISKYINRSLHYKKSKMQYQLIA